MKECNVSTSLTSSFDRLQLEDSAIALDLDGRSAVRAFLARNNPSSLPSPTFEHLNDLYTETVNLTPPKMGTCSVHLP